jgi:hypothetical protein
MKTKSSPVPASVTVWGLPSALSVMVTAPVLAPPALGSKVTLRVQLALGATLDPQLLAWEESPLALMLSMLRVALPVLLRVTISALLVVPTVWAGNVKEAGESFTVVELPPVPVRLTVWVSGLALSKMVTAPVLVPVAVGVKVTVMMQEAPAATLEPQLLVWEKFPLTLKLAMLSVAFPVFSSLTL